MAGQDAVDRTEVGDGSFRDTIAQIEVYEGAYRDPDTGEEVTAYYADASDLRKCRAETPGEALRVLADVMERGGTDGGGE